jgi:multidrug efflux pump subunit AcrB
LLFFILAAQFESLLQPFIILSELIIDIFAAMLVLWICGVSLNLMSMIGIVVMCGIVINDSILKVDTINRLRKDGMGLKHAIMEAGGRRLKSILMTSLTTILAIAPFLVRGDMGSDLQYPLSLALIAGMVAGTLVSVFFIPLAYYVIYKNTEKR